MEMVRATCWLSLVLAAGCYPAPQSLPFMASCTQNTALISDLEDGNFYFGTSCPPTARGAWYLSVGDPGRAGSVSTVITKDGPPTSLMLDLSSSPQPQVGVSVYPTSPGNQSAYAIHISGSGQQTTTSGHSRTSCFLRV
jgi:hypothetical protein